MEQEIVQLIREIGVPANLLGYEYLKTALQLCMEDPDMMHKRMMPFYADIAKRHNTTWSKVERALRYAIGTAWSAPFGELIEKCFPCPGDYRTGMPPVGEFLAVVAEELKLRVTGEGDLDYV